MNPINKLRRSQQVFRLACFALFLWRQVNVFLESINGLFQATKRRARGPSNGPAFFWQPLRASPSRLGLPCTHGDCGKDRPFAL
jgi:hypothetical protein